jgi:hypothetical protein
MVSSGVLRRMPWLAGWAAGLCLSLVMLVMCAGRAAADITVPSPPPAVLTDVVVKDVSPTETRVTLTFAPKAPTFSI